MSDQDEYVVQATNVSQPVKYTVGLPSCRFNYVSRIKLSINIGLCTLPTLNLTLSLTIVSEILWTYAKEVSLFLLSILEPGSLVLDRIRTDLNILPLRLAFSNLIYL